MVKKFIRNPSKIISKADITKTTLVKAGGRTQTGKLIRSNNRAVPLNPLASRHKPKSGNFATKRRNPRIG
ncbi:hypothetical protein ES702_02797 [subsurface metagenome]